MIQTEALIIGAGPVGLFQAFQLGLQGIEAQIIDALPHVGGQCVELYPNKPIYDIPGIAACTGIELVQKLQQQLTPFSPPTHLGFEVTELQRTNDDRWQLVAREIQNHPPAGSPEPRTLIFLARTVFIAAGVGAFQARKLMIDGATTLEGQSLHYRLPQTWLNGQDARAPHLSGQQVVIQGGDDTAIETALALIHLAPERRPAQVTLIHRRDVFQAEEAVVQSMREAVSTGQLQLRIGQITAFTAQGAQLQSLSLLTSQGEIQSVDADQLFAFLGVSPKLGPVADWGLEMARKQLVVDPQDCATSVPGIYAVGDINTYPGKKKLILCGFHEATLAAFGALGRLRPDRPALLQYTTTSSELKKRLGVGSI